MCISVDLPEPEGPMIAVKRSRVEAGADSGQGIDRGVALAVAAGQVRRDDNLSVCAHRPAPYRSRPTSLRPVALADQFDGFLIDLDGVVWIGREPVPGSLEALVALLGAGKEIAFVTNNPSRPPESLRRATGRDGRRGRRRSGSSPPGSSRRGSPAQRRAGGGAFVIGAATR